MAIATGLGLLVSAYGVYSNGKRNSSAAGDRASGMSEDQWETYKNDYLPRQKELLSRAFSQRTSPEAMAARAGVEANQAADNAAEITTRTARKAGINTASPAYADLLLKQQQNRAGLVANAKTGGRLTADQINFNRQTAALGLGQNLPGLAAQNNATAGNIEMQNNMLDRQDDMASGQLYGTTAAYLGSGLSDYLRRPKTAGSGVASGAGTGTYMAGGSRYNDFNREIGLR